MIVSTDKSDQFGLTEDEKGLVTMISEFAKHDTLAALKTHKKGDDANSPPHIVLCAIVPDPVNDSAVLVNPIAIIQHTNGSDLVPPENANVMSAEEMSMAKAILSKKLTNSTEH